MTQKQNRNHYTNYKEYENNLNELNCFWHSLDAKLQSKLEFALLYSAVSAQLATILVSVKRRTRSPAVAKEDTLQSIAVTVAVLTFKVIQGQ